MIKEKLKNFISAIFFMFKRSWKLSKETWFFSILSFVIGTVQPFAMLIIPKYIFDELAGECRMDVTLSLVALYAGVIVFFNIVNFLINHFSAVQTLKSAHNVGMFNQRKWLFMDYGNFENGKTHELAGRCVGQVDPRGFFDTTVLGFIQNAIQLAGYTYIIMSLHPLIIAFILIVIAMNTLIGKKLAKIGYEYQPLITRLSRRYGYIFNNMIDFEVAKEVRINGAGKSTFIKLLCRLYEPTEGKILVGGVDISTIRLEDYRKLLSVVFQDYELFSMSMF